MENFNRAAHRRSRGGPLIFLFRKNSTDDGRSDHGHALVSALQFKKSGFPQQLPLFPGQYRGFRLFSSGFHLIPSGHRAAGRYQRILNQQNGAPTAAATEMPEI